MLYKFKSQNLDNLISKLKVLNPMNTLKRGYAIVKINDKVIADASIIKLDDNISVELEKANIEAKVVKINEKEGK